MLIILEESVFKDVEIPDKWSNNILLALEHYHDSPPKELLVGFPDDVAHRLYDLEEMIKFFKKESNQFSDKLNKKYPPVKSEMKITLGSDGKWQFQKMNTNEEKD